MPISARDCVPRDWTRLLTPDPLGLGLDLATTEKDTSNPSSLTATQKVGRFYVERLVISWKTKRPGVTRAILRWVFADLKLVGIRPRRLCIDASNEKFFATDLKDEFNIHCPIELVVASETMEWQGEVMNMKTIQGNLYVNDFTDGIVRMPDEAFLKEDHRLVKKDKGLFIASTSPDGMHGDTFDSGKQARWALEGKGPAQIQAVSVGQNFNGKPLPAGLKNPLLREAMRRRQHTTHA